MRIWSMLFLKFFNHMVLSIGQVVCLLFVFTIFQNYCHLDTPGRLLNDTLESGENIVRLNQEECSESTQKQVQSTDQIAENQFILFLAL